ncbi:MAG: c-type cytochrome domain-containing protein [Planctomycetota bacterium]
MKLPSLILLAAALAEPVAAAEKVTYQDHVKPILREHCFACHTQGDASSGFAADDYSAVLTGGASGEVLASGDVDGSRLWKLITHEEEPEMPPGDKMPAEQLAVIKKWIEGGLLDNAGSKPKKAKRSAMAEVKVSADNRPQGEPAMPENLFRQPVVSSPRVGPITSLAASPWAPVVAVPWQRQVSLYHADKLELLGVLPYPEGDPNVVRFSRDGSVLLVAGGVGAKAGSATVFDVKTGDRLVTVGEEMDAVLAADLSPDLKLVAIGGPKKRVRVYRTADGELAYEITKHTDWVTAVRFSPDGKLLATADRNSGLLLWQARAGNPRADLRGHKRAVADLAWRADSQVLASVSEDGEARLWKRDGQSIKNFRAHGGGALGVAFARDGRLATTGRDKKVTVWSADGKAIAQLPPMTDEGLAAAFTADGKQVLASDFSGRVRLLKIESKKATGDLAANPPTLATRLSTAEQQHKSLSEESRLTEQLLAKARSDEKAATAAHAAFEQQLADAKRESREAKKLANEAARGADAAATAAKEAVAAAAKAAEVRAATEKAMAMAEEKLASPDAPSSDDPEASPGAVVQSLAAALKAAKDEERQRTAAAEAARQAAAKQAVAGAKAAETAKLAATTVEQTQSRRSGLPNLTAAETALAKAEPKHAVAKERLAAAAASIARIRAEQEAYRAAAAMAQQQVAERQAAVERLSIEAERIAQQMTAANEQATQRQSAVGLMHDEIKKLKAKLAELEATAAKAKAEAERIAGQKREIQAQLAEEQSQAERAAARRASIEAAEAARAKYLPQPAE